MPDSSRLRLALSLLAAAMLLGGLVAVVATADGAGDVVATRGDRSTTTTVVDGGEGTAAGTTDTSAADDDVASDPPTKTVDKPTTSTSKSEARGSSPGGAPTEAASDEPGPTQPTKSGTYTYDATVDGESFEATYVVEPEAGAAAGETRQAHTFKGKDGEMRNAVVWRADGLYLDKTSGSSGEGMGGDCDWDPDVLVLKLPLAVGSGWVSDSSCSGESPYGPYTVKAHFESAVTGTARMAVGAQEVDVWVIETKQHLDISAEYQGQQFNITQDSTSKRFFAPEHGISVREETESTAGTPTGQRSRSTVRQLRSLSPA